MGPDSPKNGLYRETVVRLTRASDSGEIDQTLSQLLGSTRGAVYLSVAVEEGRLTGNVRERALTLAVQQKPEIRDLFERFLPPEQRVKRLGNNVNLQQILALRGDPSSGRRLFRSDSGVACKTCHRIDGVGVQLGPDLDKIGKKYPRRQILQHILEPSRFIEPKYVSHLVETAQGEVHVGLLVAGDDSEVVLKDNKNKLVRIRKVQRRTARPTVKVDDGPNCWRATLTAQQVGGPGRLSGVAQVGKDVMRDTSSLLKVDLRTCLLSNGLTVILHQDQSLPITAVNVWYHVGSKDESPRLTGLAHLF